MSVNNDYMIIMNVKYDYINIYCNYLSFLPCLSYLLALFYRLLLCFYDSFINKLK